MAQAYRFSRRYVGGLKAAILDWSGTTADKYVIAPAVVFQEVFKRRKVPISMTEAREPMGLKKDLHMQLITEMPEVRERWFKAHGRYPNKADIDGMVEEFIPLELEVLKNYTTLIPGTVEATNRLRNEFGMKIGGSTGFFRSMVDLLLADAKKQGFVPDASVAGDDVINGARPKPFMIYRNLDIMDVHPIQAVVKVDDTVSGIGEAQEAGCWGVGVSRYSNYMNINSFEEEAQLSEDELERRNIVSKNRLIAAGAHYVVDSIADLPEVCADINKRLARGETP